MNHAPVWQRWQISARVQGGQRLDGDPWPIRDARRERLGQCLAGAACVPRARALLSVVMRCRLWVQTPCQAHRVHPRRRPLWLRPHPPTYTSRSGPHRAQSYCDSSGVRHQPRRPWLLTRDMQIASKPMGASLLMIYFPTQMQNRQFKFGTGGSRPAGSI